MKILMFIFCIIIFISGCQSKDSLKNITIVPKIYTYEDTLFLEWNFKNSTSRNLIIPTQFTYQRLDGSNHRKYEFKVEYHITGLDKDKNRTIVVPFKYLKQIPDFQPDTLLHKQVKNLVDFDDDDYIGKSDYNYIKDQSICPQMVFVSANSEKKLVFMFKPEVKGKYMIGFETKKSIDRTSLRVRGDSIVKRGVPLLQEIIGNHVEGYTFEYGEFRIDSVEVNL